MKKTLLLALGLAMTTASVYAQPATTAKAFRMLEPTGSVTLNAIGIVGTHSYTWPAPGAGGIMKSNSGGLLSLGAVSLTSEVSGILPVGNGGTGLGAVPANNLLVGNGGSALSLLAPTADAILVTNGSGAISWSTSFPASLTIPFNQITSGTNTGNTLTVGAGSTLTHTGTGVVDANRFTATGSTSNAVDLATAEVNGTLPVGNGGTGVTTLDQDEILLGNGTSGMASLNNPVGNAILTQNGVGAPEWSTSLPSGVTVPFNQVTSGNNMGQNLQVGVGSTIDLNGGTVEANVFQGAASTSNAVDLATSEVNGTLPVANGGTNNTTVGSNGAVAYSNGTSYQFTSVGSAGQFLQSQGGGAPQWVTGSIASAKGTTVGTGTYTYTVATGLGSLVGRQVVITFQNAGAGGLQTTYSIVSMNVPAGSFTVEFANNIAGTESFHWVVF